MVTISLDYLCYLYLNILILGAYCVLSIILTLRGRMDKTIMKKFKKICKWEFRKPIDQEKLIITEFVNRYTEENNIDWKEHI